MFNLPSTIALVSKQIKQMGRWAFIRYCKNLGMSFEDTYVLMFNKLPRQDGFDKMPRG